MVWLNPLPGVELNLLTQVELTRLNYQVYQINFNAYFLRSLPHLGVGCGIVSSNSCVCVMQFETYKKSLLNNVGHITEHCN